MPPYIGHPGTRKPFGSDSGVNNHTKHPEVCSDRKLPILRPYGLCHEKVPKVLRCLQIFFYFCIITIRYPLLQHIKLHHGSYITRTATHSLTIRFVNISMKVDCIFSMNPYRWFYNCILFSIKGSCLPIY